jgi:hypothetical protein
VRDGHWYDDERPDRTQECLRFSRAEVDRSLHENSWARLGWTARRPAVRAPPAARRVDARPHDAAYAHRRESVLGLSVKKNVTHIMSGPRHMTPLQELRMVDALVGGLTGAARQVALRTSGASRV